MERVEIGGQEVIVHYVDIPEKDRTVVRGIPCTTALRTMIDLAPDAPDEELRRMVAHCLERELFSPDEAMARLAEADMQDHPGAPTLRSIVEGR